MKRHIVHITGNRPHRIDRVLGPYLDEPTARAQGTKAITYSNLHGGDHSYTVYRLDFEKRSIIEVPVP